MRRHLTYANITATLALFVALGGGAYAMSKVGSQDIRNGAIRSADLRNGRGVAGQDVRPNALGGPQIDERSVDASGLVAVAAKDDAGVCDPTSSTTFLDCAKARLHLQNPARAIVIATGNEESVGAGPAAANCDIRIDGTPTGLAIAPGETTDTTSGTATNGFAKTFVPPALLSRGRHTIALSCAELTPDVRIDVPTIAAIAVNQP